MKLALCLIISSAFFTICVARALPDTRNPNLDDEVINVVRGIDSKPPGGLAPIPTHGPSKPTGFNTPPPVDPNSKTFAYNPEMKTWTEIKKGDPKPEEGTLLWNQSNDKWLTESFNS